MSLSQEVAKNPFATININTAPSGRILSVCEKIPKSTSLQGRASWGDVALCLALVSFLGGHYKQQIQNHLPSFTTSSLGKSYGKYFESKTLYLLSGGFVALSLCLYRLGIIRTQKAAEKNETKILAAHEKILAFELDREYNRTIPALKGTIEALDHHFTLSTLSTEKEVIEKIGIIAGKAKLADKPNPELTKMKENLATLTEFLNKMQTSQSDGRAEDLIPLQGTSITILEQLNKILEKMGKKDKIIPNQNGSISQILEAMKAINNHIQETAVVI